MNTKTLLQSLALVAFSASAHSATVLYSNSAGFNAALGGAATATQDFNSYAHETDLTGIDLLPAIQVSGNFPVIEAWDPPADGDANVFGHGAVGAVDPRAAGDAYYELVFGANYNAFAFDITGYDPAAAINGQHGVLQVFTTTGSVSFDITQAGLSESDPIFVGLVTDGYFTSIRWNEGPEIIGSGNEETGLDNLVAATVPSVPVPAALPLMISGLFSIGWLGRRRKV